MALDSNNPFSDYGNIVYGRRFIGRERPLRQIEGRVIRPPGGNMSIISEARLGKSSLAYNALMTRRDELVQQRTLAINFTLSSFASPREFFMALAHVSFRTLENCGWANRPIRFTADEIRAQGVERFSYWTIKDFFDETHSAGIRIIFILDEFDIAKQFVSDDNSFFDRLRDLCYRSQVTFLFVSRDPISVIENSRGKISSSLDGICQELHLGMFNQLEIETHFERLSSIGVNLTEDQRKLVVVSCGGHPYLHDKIAYELVEHFCYSGHVDLEHALRHSTGVFQAVFEAIVDRLRTRGLLQCLLDAVFASSLNIDPNSLQHLESYGLIQRKGRDYEAFSESFTEYLRKLPRQVELLSRSELKVLHCLANELQNKEIAKQLGLGDNTIKTHISSILRKLDVKNRHEAVRRAREIELID